LENKKAEVSSTSTQSGKAAVIDLEQEREKFNKKIHTNTNLDDTSELQTPRKPSIKQIQKQ